MTRVNRLKNVGIFGVGVCSGIAVYYLQKYYKVPQINAPVYASWTTSYEPSSFAKWDFNWDHREPNALVKPVKNANDPEEQNRYNEKLEKVKPSASRHLFLIRHGHYNLDGKTDQEKTLTELGRKQAEYTGVRLKELDIPYNKVVKSTLTRAQETGDIILKSVGDVVKKVQNCNMLEEGAPIPPEPPVGHWRPEEKFFTDGARIEAAFRRYFHRASPDQKSDSYTLLVCHANVIRYFVCRAMQFPPEAWLRISLNHGSITWLSITPSGRVILRTLGDSGHIPVEYLSSK